MDGHLEVIYFVTLWLVFALHSSITIGIKLPVFKIPPPPVISLIGQNVSVCKTWSCKSTSTSADDINCYCDVECIVFGDCCVDAFQRLNLTTPSAIQEAVTDRPGWYERNPDRKHSYPVMEMLNHGKCVESQSMPKTFIISSCPDHFKHTEVRNACEDLSSNDIRNTPVSLRNSNTHLVTFRNLYCALCHGLNETSVEFWNITASCQKGLVTRNLSFAEKIHTLEKCKLQFHPHRQNVDLRKCRVVDKGFCKETDINYLLCTSYLAPAILDIPSYVNGHCDLCNKIKRKNQCPCPGNCGEISNQIYHPSHAKKPGSIEKELGVIAPTPTSEIEHFGISLVMCFNFNVDFSVGIEDPASSTSYDCGSSEVFDFFQKRCRIGKCPDGYTKTEDGTCIQDHFGGQNVFMSDKNKKIKNTHIYDLELYTHTGANVSREVAVEMSQRIINTLLLNICFRMNTCVAMANDNIKDNDSITCANGIHEYRFNCFCTAEIPIETGQQLQDTMHELQHFGKHQDVKEAKVEVILKNSKNDDGIQCNDSDIIKLTDIDLVRSEGNFVNSSRLNSTILLFLSKFKFSFTSEKPGGFIRFFTYCRRKSRKLSDCVYYAVDEYDLGVNGHIFINGYEIERDDDAILIQNGSLYICADIVSTRSNITNRKYYKYEMVLTYSTHPISIVSLFALIIIHFRHQELMNIHGRCMVSFCAIFIVAQSGVLVQPLVSGINIVCIVTAVVKHYSWLCSFSWSTIIAYEFARTFRASGVITIVSGNINRRFKIYSAIAWSFPAFLVTACCIMQFTGISQLPGYGENGICKIYPSVFSFAVFTAPIGFLIIFNCVCFVIAIYGIWSANKATKLLTKHHKDKATCMVYARMFVFLGMFWVMGLVTLFIDSQIFYLCQLTVNGLQGWFILLAYTLNTRTLKMIFKTKKSQEN